MLTGLQEEGPWCPVLLGGASSPPCGAPLGPPAPATFSPACPWGPKIQTKCSGHRATGLALMWVSRCCLGGRQEGQPGRHLLLADHTDHTGCQLCPSWEQILERNCPSATWVTPPYPSSIAHKGADEQETETGQLCAQPTCSAGLGQAGHDAPLRCCWFPRRRVPPQASTVRWRSSGTHSVLSLQTQLSTTICASTSRAVSGTPRTYWCPDLPRSWCKLRNVLWKSHDTQDHPGGWETPGVAGP